MPHVTDQAMLQTHKSHWFVSLYKSRYVALWNRLHPMKCWCLFANDIAGRSGSRHFQTCSLLRDTTVSVGGPAARRPLVHSHTLTHPRIYVSFKGYGEKNLTFGSLGFIVQWWNYLYSNMMCNHRYSGEATMRCVYCWSKCHCHNNIKYSYNESQRDALFLKFIWWSTLHVSDMPTVHHQQYLNTVYTAIHASSVGVW
jgi:hypothetical protein